MHANTIEANRGKNCMYSKVRLLFFICMYPKVLSLYETVISIRPKRGRYNCGVPPFISLQVGPTHRYCYGRSHLPFSFASMRARTHDPKGLLLKWGALSLPTELVAQLVVRVLPTSIRVPLGRGFELSWRRKKRAVGTCRNSTYEWDPPEER